MPVKKDDISKDKELSFIDHLDSFRKHLIRSVLAVFIVAVVAFFFKDFIFNKIIFYPKESSFITNRLLCQLGEYLNTKALCLNETSLKLINYELAGQFLSHVMVSLLIGVIIGFPYLILELWIFIKPALKARERKYSRGLIMVTSLLFNIGIFFGYFIIVPLSVNFLSNYTISSQISNLFNFRNYISTVTTITFSTGIVFQLPVLIYFLTKMGLITPEVIKKRRKHAFILILMLSAIITPPDAFSMILIALPLYLLFEISIVICKKVYKKTELVMQG